jgi:predicted RNase H-like nuclease
VAIDIPLGLLDAAASGGRTCDQLARRRLGPRASSVFSPPVRRALEATNHAEASSLNRASGPGAGGISIQAFGIFPKLIDADTALVGSAWLRERAIEVHPEVCFSAMAGSPLEHPKKRAAGKSERRLLLGHNGFQELEGFVASARALGAGTDDALDACAATWSAWRRLHGLAECLPSDATGPNHWMRIWL